MPNLRANRSPQLGACRARAGSTRVRVTTCTVSPLSLGAKSWRRPGTRHATARRCANHLIVETATSSGQGAWVCWSCGCAAPCSRAPHGLSMAAGHVLGASERCVRSAAGWRGLAPPPARRHARTLPPRLPPPRRSPPQAEVPQHCDLPFGARPLTCIKGCDARPAAARSARFPSPPFGAAKCDGFATVLIRPRCPPYLASTWLPRFCRLDRLF